ncbi:DUF1684 domain-containing protein [Marivirga sp. S37H4]|uniref:DUF1684 domain-containing protein n=1 Tax=Marivirga aurantiaca TaxID=2802615 RepID=A0A935C7L7_9BACT|nr:DUF1684 domain-containing protein [Marivirga aurantiaca]MBK6265000.1 DUF1684 domain-containing protein [Marivirga aurantiaca]
MKPTKILTYAGVLIVIVILIFNINPNSSVPEPGNYQEEIAKHREEKHLFMKSDKASPFIEQSVPFDSLKYYEADESFKVNATVEEINDGEIHQLATSDGKEKEFQEVAILHFDLKGTHQDLTLLESKESGLYFLSFYDETSAIQTYGSGRYLETEYEPGKSKVLLDFNYAYNPYCAYTTGYSCPVPLQKNQINIPITAGEKNYD